MLTRPWRSGSGARVIDAGDPAYGLDLQRAVDDACAGGGVVFLPPLDAAQESYLVPNPPLRITRPDVSILGAGIQSRVRLVYRDRSSGSRTGQTRAVGIQISAAHPGNVLLSSFWLDLAGGAVPRAALPRAVIGVEITAENRAAVLLRDLSIKSSAADLLPPDVTGVSIGDTPASVDLDAVFFESCSLGGVDAYLDAEDIFDAARGSTVRLRDCSLRSGGHGARFRGQREVALYNCTLENNSSPAVVLEDVSHAAVVGCRFESNNRPPKGSVPSGCGSKSVQFVRGHGHGHVEVSGCYFVSSAGDGHEKTDIGLLVYKAGSTSIVGNTIWKHAVADMQIFRAAGHRGTIFPAPIMGEMRLNHLGSEVLICPAPE